MKVKNWLYPLVLFVSTLAVIIAVFFPFYNLLYTNEYIRVVIDQYGWFASFATLDPVQLAQIGIPATIGTFITITGVFAISYLVLAFVGLLFSTVITILRVVGIEIKDYDKISKIISAVLLIGAIGFIVSAVLFICLNQSGVEGLQNAHVGLQGTFALWTIVAGLVLGTIASYLARHDFVEEDKEIAEKKQKALERKLAREEKKRQEQEALEQKIKEEKKASKQTKTKKTTNKKVAKKTKTKTTTAKKTTTKNKKK